MKSKTEGLFCSACYILALIAIITGFCDLIFGVSMQRLLGLQLPEAAFTDPLLNSQFRFLGAIWMGYGFALVYALRDIRKFYWPLFGLFTFLLIGGLGRLLALLVNGVPVGTVSLAFISIAVFIEFFLAPLLVYGLHTLTQKKA